MLVALQVPEDIVPPVMDLTLERLERDYDVSGYSGAKAGLTRFEIGHLPMGMVFDQIACYQIVQLGIEARTAARGSLVSQMSRYYGG